MLKKVILLLVLSIQSCSVYMAADGTKEPKIDNFRKDMSRFQVESVLGAPVAYSKLADGSSKATYEFIAGNEPNSTRATMWLIANVLTALLVEFVATPYEYTRGETKQVKIVYDTNENVKQLEIR